MKTDDVKRVVREGYAKVAKGSGSCCGPQSSCCGTAPTAEDVSRRVGYSDAELAAAPEGANLGLGCGNPVALASLREGEVVLDLGSGAGFDCFLAAKKVGSRGRVIGVDMTPEMLEKARENARKTGVANVEFRLGEIENLPVADGSVDAVISNCVINLAPDKARVFAEAFRALKPGGRLMVSDLVLTAPLPKVVQESVAAYVGCLAGASLKDEYLRAIEQAGFEKIHVASEDSFPVDLMQNDPTAQAVVKDLKVSREEVTRIAGTVVSVKVSARKPDR
ncbi:arsenite methyltransferase [candidate division WOR-3 bacterium]|uniref:Arsenite methyltransferase n=1 Tax=candidate division WOR-3 bacterium TaxID=2052148 RepID=A0A938BRM3_UNCW3|nr:arsenite methyltransferase [candidate division WOR-3 bacterium]